MPTAAKYVKEISWATAAKAIAFLFYYALVYFLARRMGVQTWGEWSAFYALLNIVLLVSDQGINIASKRFVAQTRETPQLGGTIRHTLVLRFAASAIYVVIVAFLIPPVLRWIGQPASVSLLRHSLLLVFLYGIVDYVKGLFEALHRLRYTFVVTALEHGLKFLLVIALFSSATPFAGIVNAFTLAMALAAVAGLIALARMVPDLFQSPAPPGVLRATYFYSLPIFLMWIGSVLALEIDTIMLNHLRSAYETGLYAAAKNVVIFLPHLSVALTMGTMPGLAVFQPENADRARRVYYRMFGGVIALYLVVSLGVVAFAFFGLELFFGPGYGGARLPLLILSFFAFLSGISAFSGIFLDYRGFAALRAVNFTFTLVANILLNWWWIPKWGAAGAAAASSVAFIPYCLLNIWQAHKAFGVRSSG